MKTILILMLTISLQAGTITEPTPIENQKSYTTTTDNSDGYYTFTLTKDTTVVFNITAIKYNLAYRDSIIASFKFYDEDFNKVIVNPDTWNPVCSVKALYDGEVSHCKLKKGTYIILQDMPLEITFNLLSTRFASDIKETDDTTKYTLTKDYINALGSGWHLIGSSVAVENNEIFENLKYVWKYNNTWMNIKQNAQNSPKENIKAFDGFWIYKEWYFIGLNVMSEAVHNFVSETDSF